MSPSDHSEVPMLKKCTKRSCSLCAAVLPQGQHALNLKCRDRHRVSASSASLSCAFCASADPDLHKSSSYSGLSLLSHQVISLSPPLHCCGLSHWTALHQTLKAFAFQNQPRQSLPFSFFIMNVFSWLFTHQVEKGKEKLCVSHNCKLMLTLQATATYSTSLWGSLLLNAYGQPLKSRKHQTGKHENEFKTRSLRHWQIVVYLIRAKNWNVNQTFLFSNQISANANCLELQCWTKWI